jgi:hypothetical protein
VPIITDMPLTTLKCLHPFVKKVHKRPAKSHK